MKLTIDEKWIKADPNFNKMIENLRLEQDVTDSLSITGLSENLMQKLPYNYFSKLEEIIIIDSYINSFLEQSQYFSSLKRLVISQDKEKIKDFQIISDNITTLSNLERLHIDSIRLKQIPENIHKLTSIRELVLSTNCLPPSSLHLLPNLKGLDIYTASESVDLEEVVKTISQIKNLKVLSYGEHFSDKAPEFGDNLLSLESLSLQMVHLKTLPSILPKLTQLKQLRLATDLQAVPNWLSEFKNLEYLAFDYIADRELPVFLKELPKLEAIDLRGCLDIFFDESKVEKIKRNFKDFKVLGVNANY